MKKLIIILSVVLLQSCSSHQNNVVIQHAQPQNVTVQSNDITGFDINKFSELLKTTTSPDALTQALNVNGNNINNLDLDEDNEIDYLKVDQIDATTI